MAAFYWMLLFILDYFIRFEILNKTQIQMIFSKQDTFAKSVFLYDLTPLFYFISRIKNRTQISLFIIIFGKNRTEIQLDSMPKFVL